MKIIINADDVGRNEEVNRLTFDLVGQKKVTSVTVVAGGEAVEEVAKAYRHFPECSFGVHLYLSDFSPLTKSEHFAPYITEKGKFPTNARYYKYSLNLRKSVLMEWSAQVARLKSLGIKISHLDSHHHIHTFPPLFMVLKQLQKDTGIRKARISANYYTEPPNKLLLFKKHIYNTLLRNYIRTTTTSRFIGFRTFHDSLSLGPISKIRSMELMVHPAAVSYMEASQAKLCEQEISDLCSNWQAKLSQYYQLINYRDL
jgi:predicted glycoside hydrolase/deacetylase ChbG (UPF0249 family)